MGGGGVTPEAGIPRTESQSSRAQPERLKNPAKSAWTRRVKCSGNLLPSSAR